MCQSLLYIYPCRNTFWDGSLSLTFYRHLGSCHNYTGFKFRINHNMSMKEDLSFHSNWCKALRLNQNSHVTIKTSPQIQTTPKQRKTPSTSSPHTSSPHDCNQQKMKSQYAYNTDNTPQTHCIMAHLICVCVYVCVLTWWQEENICLPCGSTGIMPIKQF